MSVRPRPYIVKLNPYQPGLPIDVVARHYGLESDKIIKLASNENPLGMSPKAKAALKRALNEAHRYPGQYELTHKLAATLGVEPAQVVLGNGSNDVLDLVARTFLGPGDEAISSQYAFAIYAIATQSAGAANVVVPAKRYGHDLAAMAAAITPRTKVIWIANPNNPTGTFVSYAEVKRFLAELPRRVVVVLDEAYYEYLEENERPNTVEWLKAHPNLVITRTFSKIYGLAGLRVGYGVAAPAIVELLNCVRQPFNVGVLGLAAACAALEDQNFVERSRQINARGRKQLLAGLRDLGLECLPAHGNFVTFRTRNTQQLCQKLLRQGIIIRPLSGYSMPHWLRVTIGTRQQNVEFLAQLAALSRS